MILIQPAGWTQTFEVGVRMTTTSLGADGEACCGSEPASCSTGSPLKSISPSGPDGACPSR
jgi:hypothetical protein